MGGTDHRKLNTLLKAAAFCRAMMFICLLMAAPVISCASDIPATETAASTNLYVKVQLISPLRVSVLLPGNVVEGTLSQDVYSGDRKLFSGGSPVSLTVDRIEQRRRLPNDHWPWVIRFFTPRHERYPVFKTATVRSLDGRKIPLRVSLISFASKVELQVGQRRNAAKSVATTEKSKVAPHVGGASPRPDATGFEKQTRGPSLTLEAALMPGDGIFQASGGRAARGGAGVLPIPPGTQARAILLRPLSASKSHPGDLFQGRLLYPILSGSTVVLPAGSLLEGRVVSSAHPRWLSRPGSLYLAFTGVAAPAGELPLTISITQVEVDAGSRTRMDSEGKLIGGRPGKAWMLANLGATAGISKVADDGTQLLVEAIVSTATDASTAGMARIIAACISGGFLVTRRGRDVVLPKFTEINIVFDRPPAESIPAQNLR